MSNRRLLGDAVAIKALAERLARCQSVTKFDLGEEQEAWVLAHALGDLEESFRKVIDEQLPRLTEGQLTESELHDLLLEIGEEFRHILYHIKDPQFYRYLSSEHKD